MIDLFLCGNANKKRCQACESAVRNETTEYSGLSIRVKRPPKLDPARRPPWLAPPLLLRGTCRPSRLYIRPLPPRRPTVLMHHPSQPPLDIQHAALSPSSGPSDCAPRQALSRVRSVSPVRPPDLHGPT